jgi:hypothetical protein
MDDRGEQVGDDGDGNHREGVNRLWLMGLGLPWRSRGAVIHGRTPETNGYANHASKMAIKASPGYSASVPSGVC